MHELFENGQLDEGPHFCPDDCRHPVLILVHGVPLMVAVDRDGRPEVGVLASDRDSYLQSFMPPESYAQLRRLTVR
ncbi:hypothetical protein QTH91_05900 [Variovorax dokdonensis]|uniref:Uncharacterized protein n=1 Tax=Variovorax dokdonensis TaxID=344883 RepID=A0ABT7N7V8_9BURK|nr:hypothetical protein [Variovorax dokdonensis]MDM0044007.1 hypothetical protein [Variovorax dokdonensis]